VVADCSKDSYTNASSDGKAAPDEAECLRARRGGAWDYYPWYLRSAYRDKLWPTSRYNYVGFRLARTLDEAEARSRTEETAQTVGKEDVRFASADVIAQASRRLESGDVLGAREILAAADRGNQGLISFALAETYDPNMLGAWGARGVAPDVARARELYRKALSLGVASAHGRLEALK
jgi:hypothetical protein